MSQLELLHPDGTKIKNYEELNDELSKINMNRDAVQEGRPKLSNKPSLTVTVPARLCADDVDRAPHKQERRVSRFKVSVISEPDTSNLAVSEKMKDDENVGIVGQMDDGNRAFVVECKGDDVRQVINNAYEKLETVISSSYPANGEFVPSCRVDVLVLISCS